MSAELDGLRAAASAAGGCGMVEDCTDPAHEWYGYGELSARLEGGLRTHEAAEFIALTPPSVVLALIARVEVAEAAVAQVRKLVDTDAVQRQACAADPDCGCAYKDCFECGKWHNCHHTPLTAVRDALEDASDDAGSPVRPADGLSGPEAGRDGEGL